MASVKSLGLHQPTGLRWAIEEEILPQDPPPSSYTWEIIPSTDPDTGDELEDELLTTETCVVWSRGNLFRKAFRFDVHKETVTQALLTYFPTSSDGRAVAAANSENTAKPSTDATDSSLSRALVVLLKTSAHIHFLSGTVHMVHMPFEVETACAAPVGVVIQRKVARAEALSLRIPRVPPNTFVTSPLSSSFTQRPDIPFSTDGLGKPRTLPLRLSANLENMWHVEPSIIPQRESPWPRLVCLTDPLNELGLIVSRETEKQHTKPQLLDQADEIVHVEAVQLPGAPETRPEDLIFVVTVNRQTSLYTVWRMTYLDSEDIFMARQRLRSREGSSRRRSSLAPSTTGGATSPVGSGPGSIRESFGAPLPGKKKSGKAKEKTVPDSALVALDPENVMSLNRRQSRRVSSLLARADLSTSQERSVFPSDVSVIPGQSTRRLESQGSQGSRLSGTYGRTSMSGTFNPNLNSLAEAPVDSLLDELRAGGNFEGFDQMGLEDRKMDGLTREMLLTKLTAVPIDNTNVRYSLSEKPARAQSRIFILVGPVTATNERGEIQVLIGLQDPVDKRLQLLPMSVDRQVRQPTSIRSGKCSTLASVAIKITCGQLRKAQSVVDSCKLADGDQFILILSEDGHGVRELSLQAPWGFLTPIALPILYYDNLDSLDYEGEHTVDKEMRGRRSTGIGVTASLIDGLCNPKFRGVVDLRQDKEGRFHRVRIKLQPSTPLVRETLDVCRSVLASGHANKLVVGWWHVMVWRSQHSEVAEATPHEEWSTLVILLLASFLVLGHASEASLLGGHGVPAPQVSSGRKWDEMMVYETKNAAAFPSWMGNRGWRWLLDEGALKPKVIPSNISLSASENNLAEAGRGHAPPSFMSRHISLAKKFMASASGLAALGTQGFLPTALGHGPARNNAAEAMMLAMHLFQEERKLNAMATDEGSPGQTDLRVLLWQLAKWLRWERYEAVYELGFQAELEPKHDAELIATPDIPEPPTVYSMYDWLQTRFTTDDKADFLTLGRVFMGGTRDALGAQARETEWKALTPRTLMFDTLFRKLKPGYSYVEMVVAMHECGFNANILESLPEAVLVPLQDAIVLCQPNPPPTWPKELLSLVNRTDVGMLLQPGGQSTQHGAYVHAPPHTATLDFSMICQEENETENGGETEATQRQAVIRALFKEDRRLNEAQDLLACHKVRQVQLKPLPDWSESEYLEKQKEKATNMATSTLAIPAGRGLLYYGLRYPLLTQKFSIGGFNLTCNIKPANNIVGVDKTHFTEEKINWAFFHNGVASGLAISPNAKGIDTSWILYNKPAQDLSNRHGGFLLAMGLNGHLRNVARWVVLKYLTPKHTMTTIGLLLGLGFSYLGTMDSLAIRMVSVHVVRMLPRGAVELNLSKHMQTAGIMSIGLLYCRTQHRRMSEIMLSEIGHIGDDEEEDVLRDEGYRLAAGFSLGLVNLAKGRNLKGLHDMRLTETLLTLATATKKVELVHVLDRAAPGAVMAVALIFLKLEDPVVARKIDVPDSVLQFDYVRPDVLLLRTVAKNLILWSRIQPSFEWVECSLPREYRHRSRLQGNTPLQSKDLPFFSILAGLCFSLGLRFAGSSNTGVRDLLVHYLDQFMRIAKLVATHFDTHVARRNARMCMDVLALSSAAVMAGTGDLIVLRRLRSLHGRDDQTTTYGSHLAAHLAIGVLFMSCGSQTFGTGNLAVASLLIAFYPIFPSAVQDNRAHLQAFRHFWVLAAEPRCLVTRDMATGQVVSVPVVIHHQKRPNAGADNEVHATPKLTPCLLPPLEEITLVRTDAGAQGYWDLEVDFTTEEKRTAFRVNQTIHLQRRPAVGSSFSGTLRAMDNQAQTSGPQQDVAGLEGGIEKDPFEWVFGLGGLKDLTHAERALGMDLLGNGGGVGEGEGMTTGVDARLVLRRAVEGWKREGLEGLRLSFAWADGRSGREQAREEGESSEWWMRDGVVNELKGRALLAWREG